MWSLTQRWYGDRLVPGHRSKPVDELQRLLDDVGLTDDFWQLR